ncbi:MAG: hypothetical protein ACJAXW_004412 [Candidatus Azotimanducaceae bacterium]|jgi:hypothetical protein
MNHPQSSRRKSICQYWAAAVFCLASLPALGHGVVPNLPANEREIHFFNVEGYEILVLDLHTHSVSQTDQTELLSLNTLSGSHISWISRILIETGRSNWRRLLQKS